MLLSLWEFCSHTEKILVDLTRLTVCNFYLLFETSEELLLNDVCYQKIYSILRVLIGLCLCLPADFQNAK